MKKLLTLVAILFALNASAQVAISDSSTYVYMKQKGKPPVVLPKNNYLIKTDLADSTHIIISAGAVPQGVAYDFYYSQCTLPTSTGVTNLINKLAKILNK